MDYQKMEPSPYSFEEELARRRGGRESSGGAALIVLVGVLIVLALIIFVSEINVGDETGSVNAAPDASAPAILADGVPANNDAN
jgi:hypothetical protein